MHPSFHPVSAVTLATAAALLLATGTSASPPPSPPLITPGPDSSHAALLAARQQTTPTAVTDPHSSECIASYNSVFRDLPVPPPAVRSYFAREVSSIAEDSVTADDWEERSRSALKFYATADYVSFCSAASAGAPTRAFPGDSAAEAGWREYYSASTSFIRQSSVQSSARRLASDCSDVVGVSASAMYIVATDYSECATAYKAQATRYVEAGQSVIDEEQAATRTSSGGQVAGTTSQSTGAAWRARQTGCAVAAGVAAAAVVGAVGAMGV
ncbi:hypothetical protein QBC42DRAFT_263585 [Cladorrhinum samala]|uniref:Uncharacterized protein n=1 Tax=Cladorrhinum samala TaxID=585594 RepID=A0AAV9HZ45_9PEZI|nr:hypothetical protein QBC42DRAFT_263585 [Cladorrhinum samala]